MKQILFLLFSFIIAYAPSVASTSSGSSSGGNTTGGSTTGGTTGDGSSSTGGSSGDSSGSSTGVNAMMGGMLGRNLASLAFDAETSQRVAGGIDIVTGGYLVKKNCPPVTPPNPFLCMVGLSAIANGGASLKSSKKSKKAGEDLGGDGPSNTSGDSSTGGNTDSGPTCSDGNPCPANGQCPDGTTCTPPETPGPPGGGDSDGDDTTEGSTDSGPTCSDGNPCPASGLCPDGTVCNSNRNVPCDENPNQAKCKISSPPSPDFPDCKDWLGADCDQYMRDICLRIPNNCRVDLNTGELIFFSPTGDPLAPGDLDDIGGQLGLTPEEIQDAKDKLASAQRRAASQVGSKLKSHGAFSSAGEEALSTDSSKEFEPSLSKGGGGSSANGRNSNRRKGAKSPSLARQLQSLLDKNHKSSVKKHGYTPKTLGNQPIGTSHDNIFDMMSRGYQTREDSLNVR